MFYYWYNDIITGSRYLGFDQSSNTKSLCLFLYYFVLDFYFLELHLKKDSSHLYHQSQLPVVRLQTSPFPLLHLCIFFSVIMVGWHAHWHQHDALIPDTNNSSTKLLSNNDMRWQVQRWQKTPKNIFLTYLHSLWCNFLKSLFTEQIHWIKTSHIVFY